jgi:hypothetical protein
MAITDYIPNVFGSSAPTTYEGLLGMGLITPEQMKKQQNVANIQGLLGAGLALAQGMSRIGPRRSAAENILGALAGGFGAAGGAYQQGLQNVVQQQQLQSAALTQAQAANKIKSIQAAKLANPDLAYLADIDTGEFVKQVMARDRAKLYGFGTESQPTGVSAEMPTQVTPQVKLEPGLIVTSKGTNMVGVPNFDAGDKYVDENLNQQARQLLQQKQVQQQPVSMVDPASVAKANDARRKAALAISMGDKDTATFFQNEAERLDPKEQLFFRDDKLVSSKRGIIGDFSGGKILTDEQATALGLDPNRGKWTIKGGIPSLISGTSTTKVLNPEEVLQLGLSPDLTYQRTPDGEIKTVTKTAAVTTLSKEDAIARGLNPNYIYQVDNTGKITQVSGSGSAQTLSDAEAQKLGLNTRQGQRYQRKADGSIDLIQGTVSSYTNLLSPEEAKARGLPTDRGQVYQIDQNGKVDLVQGTVADREKFTGEYANLALTMFGTSDISKLSPEQRAKVDKEAERRGISKAKAGASTIYTGQLSKTTAGQVEQSVITTADAVTRLNNIQFSYKPQYQNIGFRSKQAWNTIRDKFGGLPDTEKRQLAEYSQYRQNALQNLNQTIKDITGAAMGVQEAERIIATLPNAGADIFSGDSPTEFEAKLNNGIKQTKYALARKQYSLRKGLNWENTPLDKMPSIINSRGAEIAKQYNLDPNKPADLQTINRQLAAEFGVSF